MAHSEGLKHSETEVARPLKLAEQPSCYEIAAPATQYLLKSRDACDNAFLNQKEGIFSEP